MGKKSNRLLIVFAVFSLLALSVRHAMQNGVKTFRYTIGTTTSAYKGYYGNSVFYEYIVNNEKIKGSITFPEMKIKVPGGRYFVKYNAKDAYMAELMKDKPVPANITEVPINGWAEVPQ